MQPMIQSNAKVQVIRGPVPAVVIDDFLPQQIIESLLGKMPRALCGPEFHHPDGYKMNAFFNEPMIRYLYRFVRNELPELIPGKYTWSNLFRLPQLQRMKGPCRGLTSRVGQGMSRDLGMIIHLGQNWRPNYGGELNLFSRSSDYDEIPNHVIAPVFNRAVFFLIGPDACYSISDLKENWDWSIVSQDWSAQWDWHHDISYSMTADLT